jgi:anti-sigma B factor antagonist
MYSHDRQGPWTVVHPRGEIDLATAAEFREAVLAALQGADLVAIDLSEVTFMDSSGIGVIAAGLKHTRNHGGTLVLVGLPEQVRFVLEVTGLDRIVEIRPTVLDLDVGRAAS